MANTRLNSLWCCFLIRGRLSGIWTDGKWATPHLLQTYEPQSQNRDDILQIQTKKCPALTLQKIQVWWSNNPFTLTYCYYIALPYCVRSQWSTYLAVQCWSISHNKLIKITCLYYSLSENKTQRKEGHTALSPSDFPSLLQLCHGVPRSSGTIKTSVSHTYPVPLNSLT